MAKKKDSSGEQRKQKTRWDQVFCDFRCKDDADLFYMLLTEETGVKKNKLRLIPYPQRDLDSFSVVMSPVSLKEREMLDSESKKFGRVSFRSI